MNDNYESFLAGFAEAAGVDRDEAEEVGRTGRSCSQTVSGVESKAAVGTQVLRWAGSTTNSTASEKEI